MDARSSDRPIDIYARVSKARPSKRQRGDARELSTPGQVAACRAVLAERGLAEGEAHIDPGRSAWNPKVKRPAWDALMSRLEAGTSGGVIVFDLERFSRQPEDGERLIKAAARGLAVLDSESDYDLRTPNGKKAFRDAMTAAAYYSDRGSTKVQRGLKQRAMDGEPLGSVRPFGFEADKVTIRESEAAVLRELTARVLAGETQEALINDLHARGIVTSAGNAFRVNNLRALLTRERNCGRIIHTDQETGVTSVVGKLPGPPIVSEDDFDRVCAVYASRRRGRPNSPHYVCSALAVCAKCGTPLYGRLRSDLLPYPDGAPRRHYWCHNPVLGGCARTLIDQRALDECAGELVAEIMADRRNADAIETAARELASEAGRLDAEIGDAEAVALALADRLGRGELTLARYDVAMAPLDKRLARLRSERAGLGEAGQGEAPAEEASRAQWRQRWQDAGAAERRNLLTTALRGRRLVVAPAGRGSGSADPADVRARVSLG